MSQIITPHDVSITPLVRDAILAAYRAGVVPAVGHEHVQVGRDAELEALLADLHTIAAGGTTCRFLVGPNGAGKTFLADLNRVLAHRHNLVTMHADFTIQRRLVGSNGEGRALYAALIASLATRDVPRGGALESVLDRLEDRVTEAASVEGVGFDQAARDLLRGLHDQPGGSDFATAVHQALTQGSSASVEQRDGALRWLRGEYSTRTDARRATGIPTLITDVIDSLRHVALLVCLAGYDGVVATLDELVSVTRATGVARTRNFERILTIINETHNRAGSSLGIVFGATPDALDAPRRGLRADPALSGRLPQNPYANGHRADHRGIVMHLDVLPPEAVLVLLHNLRHVHAFGDSARYTMPDEALVAFMNSMRQRLGSCCFSTPREIATAFVTFLDTLDANPGQLWSELLAKQPEQSLADTEQEHDVLAALRL